MDIRVAAYGTNTVTSFANSNRTTSTYVQSAAQSAPVEAAAPVNAASRGSQIANGGNGGGYTDQVRGSIINILA